MLPAILSCEAARLDDDLTAGEPLTDEVVRLTVEDEFHSLRCKGTKRLTSSAVQIEGDVNMHIGLGATKSKFAWEARTDRAITIGNWGVDHVGLPCLDGLESGRDPLFIDRRLRQWLIVPSSHPPARTIPNLGKHLREVKIAVEPNLFEQVRAADRSFQRWQTIACKEML